MKRHSAKLQLNITSLLNEGVSNSYERWNNEKRKDDMRKRVRHTQLMKLLTTPLLGSHVRIQLQLCKFFQAFFFQFFFLFHLGQEVLDPILTFFIRTRDESHCINKICPKTQRFQTFSQPVGWILLSTPMRERQLSSTVEVLAILYSKL